MRQSVGVECVGLYDVGTGLEICPVDMADMLFGCDVEQIDISGERTWVRQKTRTAEFILGKMQALDEHSHGAVQH